MWTNCCSAKVLWSNQLQSHRPCPHFLTRITFVRPNLSLRSNPFGAQVPCFWVGWLPCHARNLQPESGSNWLESSWFPSISFAYLSSRYFLYKCQKAHLFSECTAPVLTLEQWPYLIVFAYHSEPLIAFYSVRRGFYASPQANQRRSFWPQCFLRRKEHSSNLAGTP